MNVEIKKKIVPGKLNGPNTAESSLPRYLIISCTDIMGDEEANQRGWGNMRIILNADAQLALTTYEKTLTLGSNDEKSSAIPL